ncbi:MAG: hypothetical protein PHN69_04180 [Candidatus Pacebacteria bacterium]|nr:hypothetical protein [Candidatus Paceibacterota bacterium]
MINWELSYHNGTSYVTYYTISNPTNELDVQYTSNRTKYNLYDGSIGRTIPINKTVYGDVTLEFDLLSQDDNLILSATPKMSLEDIVKNGYKVKFKTHLTDSTNKRYVLEGYLTDVSKPWIVGLIQKSGTYKQFFNLSCTMDIIGETWV